jgi:hypothetical protein
MGYLTHCALRIEVFVADFLAVFRPVCPPGNSIPSPTSYSLPTV